MGRSTVDIGIDLGTTNSSIARFKDSGIEVLKNNEGLEFTPSAGWLDRRNRLVVGQPARQRLEEDPANTAAEFKLQMGTNTEYIFARSGLRLRPETLSAEVLKSLKADAEHRIGEVLTAAVITVPASFELPQCEATRQAAVAAGFSFSPLLQEPVAAALAYGFHRRDQHGFWIVYDFGGGTFDVAVVQSRDGILQVVNHGGDNHLGSKLIDWALVEQILIPALLREYPLADFRRGNPKWKSAIARLKLAAEEAKVRLSRQDAAEIQLEALCQDDRGLPVDFCFDLKQADLVRLAEPLIRQSVHICRRVLEEKRLAPGDIEKMVLVGGPTNAPYLRDLLTAELEIALDCSVDPLTVVARGAAVFAAGQKLPMEAGQYNETDEYSLELDYKPVGSEQELLVGGRVKAPDGASPAGLTIEFTDTDVTPVWRSDKIPVAENGTFMTHLRAQGGDTHRYSIELYDVTGAPLPATPGEITYTIGPTISGQPLSHDIGIAKTNNEVDVLFEKGTPLPAKQRRLLRQVHEVRRDDQHGLIRIPLVEGGYLRADCNRQIGELVVQAAEIRRDVPAGSEVEVTVAIDASRLLTMTAYIPVLDAEYEGSFNYEYYRLKAHDLNRLKQELASLEKRIAELRLKISEVGGLKPGQLLRELDRQGSIQMLRELLDTVTGDADAAQKCEQQLLELRQTIGDIESALEWPELVVEAETNLCQTRDQVEKYGTTLERDTFAVLEKETGELKRIGDTRLLRKKIDELWSLRRAILWRQPDHLSAVLHRLYGRRREMRDRERAETLFARAEEAERNVDLLNLAALIGQLLGQLPDVQQAALEKAFGSTVI